MKQPKRKRAISVRELLDTNFDVLDFDGEMLELFGKPEKGGCWIVWGESFSGKTSFLMQLCKYLTRFGKVEYNSIEEGHSDSLKTACKRENMIECGSRFQILDKEPIEELERRLVKRKSADIVVIDSIQYTELNKRTAKEFVDRHPRKLFIFVSHAAGKLPDGRTANAIRYHASVKIRTEGYRAKINSRYGGNRKSHYTIWEEGAAEYWNEFKNESNEQDKNNQ